MPINNTRGRGRNGGDKMGPGGNCVCPECGATTPHERGIPCYNKKCPKCGAQMIRGSWNAKMLQMWQTNKL